MTNHLYYGDNLEVLRASIASESVDLIYLDPPFNSNAATTCCSRARRGTPARRRSRHSTKPGTGRTRPRPPLAQMSSSVAHGAPPPCGSLCRTQHVHEDCKAVLPTEALVAIDVDGRNLAQSRGKRHIQGVLSRDLGRYLARHIPEVDAAPSRALRRRRSRGGRQDCRARARPRQCRGRRSDPLP